MGDRMGDKFNSGDSNSNPGYVLRSIEVDSINLRASQQQHEAVEQELIDDTFNVASMKYLDEQVKQGQLRDSAARAIIQKR